MPIKVAINGAGRIGRAFFRASLLREELEVVAINDLADIENIAYLINNDSVYGRLAQPIEVDKEAGELISSGRRIKFVQEKDPQALPWGQLAVDVVVESTGIFTSFEKAGWHIAAGAKRVVLSAPAKDEPANPTHKNILLGANEDELQSCTVSSNASCTTNAASPVVQILNETIGIDKALLNTVHAYTASQPVVDSFNSKNMQLGRAAAVNIVPTSTGAATATTKVITDLDGRFDGIALRVPVVAGSVLDLTFVSGRATSVEEVNEILRQAASSDRWRRIFAVSETSLVSTDIVGSSYGSVADLSFTKVVGDNLVKVLAWYDNESSYTSMLLEHVVLSGSYLNQEG